MSQPVPGEGQDFGGVGGAALSGGDEWCKKESHSLRQTHHPLLRPLQPLTPARGPEGPCGPAAGGGEGGRGPRGRGLSSFYHRPSYRPPPAPSQGRGGRQGAPRGAASSGGAHSGRETFGGSHFLARPGGGRGRCQMPGGRGKGGEAPAAIPPARRKTAI